MQLVEMLPVGTIYEKHVKEEQYSAIIWVVRAMVKDVEGEERGKTAHSCRCYEFYGSHHHVREGILPNNEHCHSC